MTMATFPEDTIVRRFLCRWVVRFSVGVLFLYSTAHLPPLHSFPPRLPDTGSAFTHFDPYSSDLLFQEAAASEKFSIESASESKQVIVLRRCLDLCPQVRERDNRIWSVQEAVSLPFLLFFPRRLSPPSAEGDPFLS